MVRLGSKGEGPLSGLHCGALLTIARDDDYIARLTEAETIFWARVEAARG